MFEEVGGQVVQVPAIPREAASAYEEVMLDYGFRAGAESLRVAG
ncbi:hypothetical protein AB0H60_21325 [Nocardia rhamnosiphila]